MSESSEAPPVSDPILDEVKRFYEGHHEGLEASRRRHRYYYDYLTRVLQVRVPAGQRVLDVGCGSGHTLAALRPSHGVGIDVSRPGDPDRPRSSTAASRCTSSRAMAPDPEFWPTRGAVRHHPPGQRGHPPHRRPGHARAPPGALPRAHTGPDLQLQPAVAAAAAPRGAAPAQVPPAARGLAAAGGGPQHDAAWRTSRWCATTARSSARPTCRRSQTCSTAIWGGCRASTGCR